jgi:L-lactate dehydrogenase complex protein LldG
MVAMTPATEQVSLLEKFTTAATNAVATVEVIDRSPAALRDAILRVAENANRILYAPPNDLPVALFGDFAADPRVVADASPDEMVHSAAGVTEAFAAVASTGSVCVNVSHERTGMVSLLAPLQIAVVAAETIVPQPRDLFRADVLDGKGLKRDFVFVTGPSATADMGPLVRGVHGPHKLHIIVLR